MSTEDNPYSEKLKTKGTAELEVISKSPQKYNELFVLAALRELQSRKALSEELQLALIRQEENQSRKKEESEYHSKVIPEDLPQTIKYASYLAYAVFVAELFNVLVFNRTTFLGIGSAQLPGSVITLGVGYFLHTGKPWAKYALYVVFLFSTIGFVLLIQNMGVVGYLQELFITASFVLVLLKPSREFYTQKKDWE